MKVCEFCGVEVAIDPPPPPPAQAWRAPPPIVVHQFRSPHAVPTRHGNPGVAIAVVGAVMGLSIAGVVVATTLGRSASRATESPNIDMPAIPGVTGPGGTARTPLSSLHTASLDWMNDVPIDAPEMVGKLDSFDVIGNWDFAMRVGHAWWEDAEMYEIAVDPIGKDGTTNLTSAGRVDYHMVSKACRKDHTKRAETEKDLKDNSCSLDLTIDKDGPSVRLDLIAPDQTGNSKPLAKPACSIQQAFDQIDKTGKLTKRPAYAIRLVSDVFGLEYRIHNASTAASMDSVDISPNFCGAKTPAPKATNAAAATTAASTPQPGPDVAFDMAAMKIALKKADTASCASKAGPSGAGRVNLVFAPNGTVASAKAQPPFQGTDRGACWEKAYSAVKVPAFTGAPVSVPVVISQ